jgi:hypothetical protein
MEAITMGDVLYIPVDEESGEPHTYGSSEAPCIAVFGDFWRCRQSVETKGKAIRAVALDDLPELLDGRWPHVAEISYRPSADGYRITREKVMEQAAEFVASLS